MDYEGTLSNFSRNICSHGNMDNFCNLISLEENERCSEL